MWPLFLLGLAGGALYIEREAKTKGQAPWQLRSIATTSDPLPPRTDAITLSLYNTQSGEIRNLSGMRVSDADPEGKFTITILAASGVTPYGYEPGKMILVTRDQFTGLGTH